MPKNGNVLLDYLTAGSTNEGGTKEHRFTQTTTVEATLRELRQNKNLLKRDVLLFALIALPGVRDLGVQSPDSGPRGAHLVKLHAGLSDLSLNVWHKVIRTHLPCDWTKNGETELSAPLNIHLRVHNRITLQDKTDIAKLDTLRFYNQSPFQEKITPTPKLHVEPTWHILDATNSNQSAECFPTQKTDQEAKLKEPRKAYKFTLKRQRSSNTEQPKKAERTVTQNARKVAELNRTDASKRFSNFLSDSVNASLLLDNEELREIFESGLTKPSTAEDFKHFATLLKEIIENPLDSLPLAEIPPFDKLSPENQEYFDKHLRPVTVDPGQNSYHDHNLKEFQP